MTQTDGTEPTDSHRNHIEKVASIRNRAPSIKRSTFRVTRVVTTGATNRSKAFTTGFDRPTRTENLEFAVTKIRSTNDEMFVL